MSNPDLNAFAKYIPGFEFLHNLTRQAAGNAAPGGQSAVPGMPPMSHWVAPTFDVEELDKRIQDLRAVHFWLDQNTKALGATIQALEVQKMTLATLKGMNMSLGDIADAFKIRPEAMSGADAPQAQAAAAPAPQPQAAASAPAEDAATAGDEPSAPAVDPMQWWNSLTEQFQTIATGAVRDMADHASRAAETMTQVVQATASATSDAQPAPTEAPAPARKRPARQAAAPRAPAGKTSRSPAGKASAPRKAAQAPAAAKTPSKPKAASRAPAAPRRAKG